MEGGQEDRVGCQNISTLLFPLLVAHFQWFLTEVERVENPFVEKDDGGAEGDPDTANGEVSRLLAPQRSRRRPSRVVTLLTSRKTRDVVMTWAAATFPPRD